MDKYAHLIVTEWDQAFLSTPSFVSWFEQQTLIQPISPGEPLNDYVKTRVIAENERKAREAAQTAALAQAQLRPQLNGMAGGSSIYPIGGYQQQTVNPALLSGATPPAQAAPPPAPASKVKSASASGPAAAASTSAVKLKAVDTTRWDNASPGLMSKITELKLSRAPHEAATKLAQTLVEFNVPAGTSSPWGDSSLVPPHGRLEVAKQLNRRGPSEFWKAWLSPAVIATGGMDVMYDWFVGATQNFYAKKVPENETDKDKIRRERNKRMAHELDPTLPPLLTALSKMTFTREQLANKWKMGPRMMKVVDKSKDATAVSRAKDLVAEWKKLQADNKKVETKVDVKADIKRKAETVDVANKKPKPAPAPAPSAAKSVTSMFAARALPTAPKRAAPPPTAAAPVVVKADPFASALNAIGAKPANAAAAQGIASAVASQAQPAKKKKNVRWRPDEELVQMREIPGRRALAEMARGHFGENYDYDAAEVEADAEEEEKDVKEMDQGEGQAMMQHFEDEDEFDPMDEDIDWYEPAPIFIPTGEEWDSFHSDINSDERTRIDGIPKAEQDMDIECNTPHSPKLEPADASELPKVKTMQLSAELQTDPVVQRAISDAQTRTPGAAPTFVKDNDISALLGQLQQAGVVTAQAGPSAVPTFGGNAHLTAAQSIDPDILKQIASDPSKVAQVLQDQPNLQALASQLTNSLSALNSHPPPPTGGPPQAYAPQPNVGYGALSSAPPTANAYGYAPGYNPPPPGIPAGFPPVPQWQNGYAAPTVPGGGWGAPRPPTDNPYGYDNPTVGGQVFTNGRSGSTGIVCKFFTTRRGCDFGNKCKNIHDPSLKKSD